MKTIIYFFAILLITFCLKTTIKAQAVVGLESGYVLTLYNDVRIPGDKGTFFSLSDDLRANPKLFYRLKGSYTINSRHTFAVLYAPLQIKSEGSLPKDILFEGVVFAANSPLKSTYKFNSYRLTYRYEFFQNPKFEFGLGLTAKIRDAKIAISSAGLESEKTNVGFVPIINFRFLYKIDDVFGILLDGDALAAPQGRAEDVLIALTYKFSDNYVLSAGYRVLEGGADNKVVYNFAFLNYATLGLTISF